VFWVSVFGHKHLIKEHKFMVWHLGFQPSRPPSYILNQASRKKRQYRSFCNYSAYLNKTTFSFKPLQEEEEDSVTLFYKNDEIRKKTSPFGSVVIHLGSIKSIIPSNSSFSTPAVPTCILPIDKCPLFDTA
jgi:hypothetical protein